MGRTGRSLPVLWTRAFAEQFDRLPEGDQRAVDGMLDRLAPQHHQARMASRIDVGRVHLWATPRIHAPGGACRGTWQYDDESAPQAIICWTVASVERA